MGKVRSGPHLLEAFRAGAHHEGQPLPTQPAVRPGQAAGAPPPARELSLGDPPCLVVRLSATVLATIVLVGVVVVVGAFLLGRASAGHLLAEVKGGTGREAVRETPPAEAERRAGLPAVVPGPAPPATPGAAVAAQAGTFSVQVAVYGPGKANLAEDLATFLRSQGFPDVEVRPVENQYRVLAGKFPASDDPVAERLLQAIKQRRYGNSDFRSAYIVRVP